MPHSEDPIPASVQERAVSRLEPIKVNLAILLGVALACLVLFAVSQERSNRKLERYTALQERYNTISTVSLITQKSLLRIQSEFENMLLSASEAELENARLAIQAEMASLEKAVIFFEVGGEFTETFAVNFDGLDKVSHTFRVEATEARKTIATIELRSSLSLLAQALEEYHDFCRRMLHEHGDREAPALSAELVLMHKKLTPFFMRAGEYSNRLYVQSLRDLRRATEERGRELEIHTTSLVGLTIVALGLLLITGTLVFRSANKILTERAVKTEEAARSNARLRAEIAERARTGEALRASEERFRGYFEHSQLGMSITTPDKTWVAVNPRQVAMLGYSLEELHRTDWAALTHPDDLAADLEQYGRMLAGEIDSFTMDKRFLHKDGHIVPINLSVSCVHGADGAVDLVLASYLDITDRVQAEKALMESEKALRALYDLAPVGIFTSTPEGRYLSVNQAQAAMYGYASPEEMIHCVTDIPCQIYPDPSERERLKAMLDADGRIVNLETQRKTKSGGRIWISLNMRAVPGPDGRPAFYEGFSTDITRRKLAEIATRESQIELRKLWKTVENSPATIVITDDTGAIQYVNPHFTILTGYTAEEAYGQNPRILKSGVHPPEFFQDMWRTLLSGAVWRGEICNRKKNGELFWELASISPIIGPGGDITNYVAVKEDITERMRQDMELKRALTELRAIFNASSVGIAYLDGALSVVRMNNRLAELFGHDEKRLRASGLGVLFPSPERFTQFAGEQLARLARGEMARAELQLRDRQGHPVWCSVTARSLDPAHPEGGGIWVFDDISSRIELENMRLDVERIMRHDLKAPLNGIINLPALIAEEGPLTTDQRAMLDLIQKAGERMLQQIRLSLDLYRMESGTYELRPVAVDLRRVAGTVRDELETVGRGRSVAVTVRDAGREAVPARIMGNELFCHTILENLLKNAIEATPPGDAVSIGLEARPDVVRVAIHNPGQIPAEIQPVFFEKYSTSGKTHGTGLGTYSARLMTEVQHGRIWFTSSPTQGVTVFVEFPAVPDEALPVTDQPPAPLPESPGPGRDGEWP